MGCIVLIMTLLTQSSQIARVAMLWDMVEVSYRKYDPHNLLSLFIEEPRMVLTATELASVLGSCEDGWTYLAFPVGRVSFLILWSYRHITYLL